MFGTMQTVMLLCSLFCCCDYNIFLLDDVRCLVCCIMYTKMCDVFLTEKDNTIISIGEYVIDVEGAMKSKDMLQEIIILCFKYLISRCEIRTCV